MSRSKETSGLTLPQAAQTVGYFLEHVKMSELDEGLKKRLRSAMTRAGYWTVQRYSDVGLAIEGQNQMTNNFTKPPYKPYKIQPMIDGVKVAVGKPPYTKHLYISTHWPDQNPITGFQENTENFNLSQADIDQLLQLLESAALAWLVQLYGKETATKV